MTGSPGPALSVIVPVRNEAKHIESCVASILDEAPSGGIEVIVVDGDSDDDTPGVIARRWPGDPRVRVLTNPARFVPHALNLGIAAGNTPFIGRVDGHCRVAPGYFRGCLEILRSEPTVDCVGGALINEGEGAWGRAIAAALSSPVGVGTARFRTGAAQRCDVDTLAFGVYRRDVHERVGLFDERFVRNQDDEFNLRLCLAGGRIVLDPALRVHYHVRPSPLKLFRQYYQYGFWKWFVIRKHRRAPSLRMFVPSAWLLLVAGSVLGSFFLPGGWIWPAALTVGYLVALAAEGMRMARSRGVSWWRMAVALATLHLGYGAGLLAALLRGLLPGRPSAGYRGPSELTR